MRLARIRVANPTGHPSSAEFATNGRSGASGRRIYRPVIANGPPDIETIDRRRVDPPAGCRAAAEPAYLPQRRSVDDPPSSRAWPPVSAPPPGAALVAQEALDVGDEVVARRQALLVVHRLEPLDVAACRLVEAGCRVEPGAQLARLLGELMRRDLGPEVRARPRAAARGRPSRTAPTRNGGPGRSSRGPGRPPRRPRSRAPTRAPTAPAACPAGPAMTSPRSSPGEASVPMIGTGPGVRDGGRDGTQADPLDDAEPAGQLDHVGRERAPAVVGLGADEHEQVALVEPGPAQDELGPGQGRSAAHRRSRAEAGAPGSRTAGRRRTVATTSPSSARMPERGRRRRAGIDPAVEGRQQVGAIRSCPSSSV